MMSNGSLSFLGGRLFPPLTQALILMEYIFAHLFTIKVAIFANLDFVKTVDIDGALITILLQTV